MGIKRFKGLLISDFNADILKGYINNDDNSPAVNVVSAPFGQVAQVIVEKNLECWKRRYDFALVWTRPEIAIGSFNEAVEYKRVPIKKILKEVDEYSRLLISLKDRVDIVFTASWTIPVCYRGYGMLDMKDRLGLNNILEHMNLRLSENLENGSDIYMLNAQRWVGLAGKNAFNPKMWYAAKVPLGNEVFEEAMKDIKAALNGISGGARKLIVLDLDDTLWGGIVGDIGWKNICLGGHDLTGEAYVDFQKALKALTNRGILLAIVSKNNEAIALEAIRNHPEMVLKLKDFAGWRINWDDKAKNIIELAGDLNIGLQSVVFIDDSPAERARVRGSLPEILVPEWPEDKTLYKRSLLELACFDTPSINKEDRGRTRIYSVERQRKMLRSSIGSLEDWLRSLKTKVMWEELNGVNIQRVVQLLNKTNQMNLATRRMTESGLTKWMKYPTRKIWAFRVSDKFGDLGITGIISVEAGGASCKIIDFVLSCRVIGRRVEESMLHVAVEYARSLGSKEIRAAYIKTEKNKPCLDFFERSGFQAEKNIFKWNLKKTYPIPKCVTITPGQHKRK